MCHELRKLRSGFAYDPDDPDGGVFVGNSSYGRFKAIVEHISRCNRCLSGGWRSYSAESHAGDGKLWYGNVFRDERTADQYFWLWGIDLEKGTKLPRFREVASAKIGSSDQLSTPSMIRTTQTKW